MSWAYVAGPLVIIPVLGALFLVPHPGTADVATGRVLDRAALSLLVCHGPAGSALALPASDSAASNEAKTTIGGLQLRAEW